MSCYIKLNINLPAKLKVTTSVLVALDVLSLWSVYTAVSLVLSFCCLQDVYDLVNP